MLEYANELTSLMIYVNGVKDPMIVSVAKPFHIETNSSLFIGSNSSKNNSFEGFMYLFHLYVKSPGFDSIAVFPGDSCLGYPANSSCIPLCNLTQYKLEQNCDSCPAECTLGCKDSKTCALCADDHCTACETLNQELCTECESPFIVFEKKCESCNSSSYYDQLTKTCKQCSGLCSTCESELTCTSCKNDSSLTKANLCSCNLGFSEIENECFHNLFTLIITTYMNNTLKLAFKENLSTELKNSQISITASNLSSFNVKQIDQANYQIALEFSQDVKKGSKATVKFKGLIVSNHNSLLDHYEYQANLFETKVLENKNKLKQEVDTAKSTAEKGIIIGGSVTATTSLINGDLRSIFTFLNVAEMFYSVLFFDMEIYPSLNEFLIGLRIHSKVPNFFQLIVNEDNGVKLPEIYNKYGFKTNLIFINCGVQFTFLFTFFGLFTLLIFLNKIKIIKAKLESVLNHFKYSVFLRIWVQSYFDVLNASRLGIKYSTFDNITQIANFLFCIMLIVTLT